MTREPPASVPEKPPSRWRRWLVQPVVNQLTQGMSPDKLAWTIALGIVVGVFPIMGTTSLLCFAVAWALKLNQPVMHAFSTLVYPLHIGLILVFIRMGERIHGAPLIAFSIPELLKRFEASPRQFASDFGWAAWHGVSAWLVVAPFAIYGIKALAVPLLRRAAARIHARGQGSKGEQPES